MARNKFFIYQCKQINGTSERIFKLPSFWNYEMIGIALAALEYNVPQIEVENDGTSFIFDSWNRIYQCGLEFQELEDTNIIVTLMMNEEYKKFECKKIGEDTANSNITKKLPIIVSCNDLKDYEKVLRCNYTPYKEYFCNE